jgi:hypothetical protein
MIALKDKKIRRDNENIIFVALTNVTAWLL